MKLGKMIVRKFDIELELDRITRINYLLFQLLSIEKRVKVTTFRSVITGAMNNIISCGLISIQYRTLN